jgi:hypothetical protein
MLNLEENVGSCREALGNLLRAIQDIPDTDLDQRAQAVLAVDTLRGDIEALRSSADSNLLAAMGDEPELSTKGASIEIRRGDSRKAWAHKEIAFEVAERLVQSSVDFETGEMLKSTEELVRNILDYAGVSYWKVGALSTIGISADDYCEVTEGKMKVRITRQ